MQIELSDLDTTRGTIRLVHKLVLPLYAWQAILRHAKESSLERFTNCMAPMKKRTLGLVVGIRELYDKKLSRKVVVKIGKPRRVRTGEWICPYVVIGLDSDEIQYVYGIDAVQALLLTFEGIRATLEGSRHELKWAGGDSGDTGFPRAIPTFFGSEFSRKLDLMVGKEVRRFSRAADKRKRRSGC